MVLRQDAGVASTLAAVVHGSSCGLAMRVRPNLSIDPACMESDFDKHNVPTELLSIWESRESCVLGFWRHEAWPGVAPRWAGQTMRSQVLPMASELCCNLRRRGMGEFLFLAALQIYDVADAKLAVVDVGDAFIRMLAACDLAVSMDTVHKSSDSGVCEEFSLQCAKVSHLCWRSVTMLAVRREARAVFMMIPNCATMASVADWLWVFVVRLSVVLGLTTREVLNMTSPMVSFAECLSVFIGTRQQYRPRDMAVGIFATALVGATLVDPQQIQPLGAGSREQWSAALFAVSHLVGFFIPARRVALTECELDLVTDMPVSGLQNRTKNVLIAFGLMVSSGVHRTWV